MDKAYFDKDSWTIKYEPWLNTVELEISKQEVEKMPTKWIRELIKDIVAKLLWDEK